jgi:hypothetical protein
VGLRDEVYVLLFEQAGDLSDLIAQAFEAGLRA